MHSGLLADEVIQALQYSDVLDDHIKENTIGECLGPAHDKFWQSYLTTRIVQIRKPLSDREKSVKETAGRLCKATGAQGQISLRNYVHAMCYQPYRAMQKVPLEPLQPWFESRYLLQAAIINDCTDVVKSLFNSQDFYGVFGRYHTREFTELWSNPVDLVGEFGRVDDLRMLLAHRRLSRRDTRGLVLQPAIRNGQLDLIKCVFDPR